MPCAHAGTELRNGPEHQNIHKSSVVLPIYVADVKLTMSRYVADAKLAMSNAALYALDLPPCLKSRDSNESDQNDRNTWYAYVFCAGTDTRGIAVCD